MHFHSEIFLGHIHYNFVTFITFCGLWKILSNSLHSLSLTLLSNLLLNKCNFSQKFDLGFLLILYIVIDLKNSL